METIWIPDVDDGSGYTTEARTHGSIYRTDVRVSDTGGGTAGGREGGAAAVTDAVRYRVSADDQGGGCPASPEAC